MLSFRNSQIHLVGLTWSNRMKSPLMPVSAQGLCYWADGAKGASSISGAINFPRRLRISFSSFPKRGCCCYFANSFDYLK
jgi:hypothetical protein